VPIETIAVIGSGIMGRGQHVKAGRLGKKAGRGVYDYGGPS